MLKASGGEQLANDPIARALVNELIDHASVVTPNADEARQLCNGDFSLATCGRRLSARAGNVLITGCDEPDQSVINTLYAANERPRSWRWPRLADCFHGSGCTMAATLAARLALGDDTLTAVERAQRGTWNALNAGLSVGTGQLIPGRLYTPDANDA